MPFSGNALAKYLVMGSQVIAWCTVSAMLLRRGLNQVNGVTEQQQPSYDKAYGTAGGRYVNVTAATDADHHKATKSFDNNGTPAVVAGVIMIVIAVIMLIISPTIMLMKIVEKRRRRILEADLESPPKYEDVVESAPRYSALFVFDKDGEMTLLPENNMHKEKDSIQKPLV